MDTSQNSIRPTIDETEFSGTMLVHRGEEQVVAESYSYANRSDQLPNTVDTRYGIASGCKIFTAVSICQLVEQGKLAFDTRLVDCLGEEVEQFDHSITIHQLLTHTSGVPDYFDEEVMDDFEELWINQPMYHIRTLRDFLPLFSNEPMKFAPGEKFHYNNAGYILLGRVVEKLSGMSFTSYVEEHVFKTAEMNGSGYFEMDALPAGTAFGYIDLADGSWKTNVYSLPAKGGSDGGAYVTTGDMKRFWQALSLNKLLSKELTEKLLTPHVSEDEDTYYGYGVWIDQDEKGISKFHVMGYDPGVSFHSGYYPRQDVTITVCSNRSEGAYPVVSQLEELLIK